MVEASAYAETAGKAPKRRLRRSVWSLQLSEDYVELDHGREHPEFCGDCAELYFEPPTFEVGVPVELSSDASGAWQCSPERFPSACADQPLLITKRNELEYDLTICGSTVPMVAGAHAGTLTELAWRAAWMEERRVAPFPTEVVWDASDCTYLIVDCDIDRPALVCGEGETKWGREENGPWRPVGRGAGDMCACSSPIPGGVHFEE